MSRSRSLPYDEISHEYVYGEKSITDNTAREPEHTVMWNAKTRNSNRSHLLGLLVCVFLMFIILTLSSGSNKFPASSTSGRQENACWYFRFVWCFRLATLFFQRDKGSVHLHSLSELLVPNSRNGTTRWARLQFSGGRMEKEQAGKLNRSRFSTQGMYPPFAYYLIYYLYVWSSTVKCPIRWPTDA